MREDAIMTELFPQATMAPFKYVAKTACRPTR